MKKTIPPGNAVNSFEGIFPGVRIDNLTHHSCMLQKLFPQKYFPLPKTDLNLKILMNCIHEGATTSASR